MPELIYFVNLDGTPTGEVGEKLASHTADTKLHAAFSCYVFNEQGKFLVTRRASSKKVWPGVWTNSVCGHPAPNESTQDAIVRRLTFELGMQTTDFQCILPDYTYKTPPYKDIVEHEFCPVYVARARMQPHPNPDEVEDYAWVEWDEYVKQAKADADDYSNPERDDAPKWSWWCKDQLKQLERSPEFQIFLQSLNK